MFELASALFSIADANEFRFARFYIVVKEVALAPLKSPFIVCGLSDTPVDCQSVAKDTEFDAGRGTEEILAFYFKEYPAAAPTTVSELMSIYTTVGRNLSATAAQRQAAHN